MQFLLPFASWSDCSWECTTPRWNHIWRENLKRLKRWNSEALGATWPNWPKPTDALNNRQSRQNQRLLLKPRRRSEQAVAFTWRFPRCCVPWTPIMPCWHDTLWYFGQQDVKPTGQANMFYMVVVCWCFMFVLDILASFVTSQIPQLCSSRPRSSSAFFSISWGHWDSWAESLRGYQMASYFFAGLFPLLGDAAIALHMYLYMICGDMVGSLIAFIWTSCMGSMGDVSDVSIRDVQNQIYQKYQNITFMALLLLSFLSTTTALIPSISILETTGGSAGSLVFTAFFFGSFSKAGLEALCPRVVKARLAGVLLGLSAVLLCYETVLSRSNAPPEIKAGCFEVKLVNLVNLCLTVSFWICLNLLWIYFVHFKSFLSFLVDFAHPQVIPTASHCIPRWSGPSRCPTGGVTSAAPAVALTTVSTCRTEGTSSAAMWGLALYAGHCWTISTQLGELTSTCPSR